MGISWAVNVWMSYKIKSYIIHCKKKKNRQRTVPSKSSSSDYSGNCDIVCQLCLTIKDIAQYSRLRDTANFSVN